MLGLRRPLASLKGLGADRLTLLGTVVSGHAVIHWYQQLFPVVLPSIKAGLGLNDVQVGALSSAREFSSGGFNLPSGILPTRWCGTGPSSWRHPCWPWGPPTS